jgi:hypothetical protein
MTDIAALEEQVARLTASAEILRLKYRYLDACDRKQPEVVASCFAAGPVEIDYGHIGQFDNREDFVAVFVALGCHEHIVDMHHAQNPDIELTGPDSARGHIGLQFHSLNTRDKTALRLAGHYRDSYRRIDGQWLITASYFRPHWVELRDFSGDRDVVTYAGNRMPG